MLQTTLEYGDISPKTAARVARELLKKSLPNMVMDKFSRRSREDIDWDAPFIICPHSGSCPTPCSCSKVHQKHECCSSGNVIDMHRYCCSCECVPITDVDYEECN
jgi:hypothetical protein